MRDAIINNQKTISQLTSHIQELSYDSKNSLENPKSIKGGLILELCTYSQPKLWTVITHILEGGNSRVLLRRQILKRQLSRQIFVR